VDVFGVGIGAVDGNPLDEDILPGTGSTSLLVPAEGAPSRKKNKHKIKLFFLGVPQAILIMATRSCGF
jgi:hypothetical protein